jgi:glyoxylase-like metal-dependent hydrolase (beta-lactamase superfamily II)
MWALAAGMGLVPFAPDLRREQPVVPVSHAVHIVKRQSSIVHSTRYRAQAPGFELVEVAPGVYAALRTEPGRNVVNGNSTIIVNDSDVVVVDATGTSAAARELIAAIQRLTRNPVRYLVTTHWHDDHAMGNHAFRQTWPGLEIVAHPATREAMTTTAVENRASSLKALPDILTFVRAQLAKGNGLDDTPLTAGERAGLESDLRLAQRYLAESPRFRVTLPSLTVERRLTLHRGSRTIEILHLGRGNTSGDLVVYLPHEGIVATGDLVVWPTPYVFDSYPDEWARALDTLHALNARVLIPGHGPLLRDYGYVDLIGRALRSVVAQTQAARTRGLDLEETRKAVDLEEFRRAFAGDDKVSNQTWRNYFVGPVVGRAYEEGKAEGRKGGT